MASEARQQEIGDLIVRVYEIHDLITA